MLEGLDGLEPFPGEGGPYLLRGMAPVLIWAPAHGQCTGCVGIGFFAPGIWRSLRPQSDVNIRYGSVPRVTSGRYPPASSTDMRRFQARQNGWSASNSSTAPTVGFDRGPQSFPIF